MVLVTGLKSRCWQTVFFPGGPGENPFSWLFQLWEAAHIPWLWPPSILKVSDGWSFSHRTTLTCLPLPLMFKDPDGDTGPTKVIQDESPQLKILCLITSAKALLPHEVTRVHEVHMWMWPHPNPLNFCGAITCLLHTYIYYFMHKTFLIEHGKVLLIVCLPWELFRRMAG